MHIAPVSSVAAKPIPLRAQHAQPQVRFEGLERPAKPLLKAFSMALLGLAALGCADVLMSPKTEIGAVASAESKKEETNIVKVTSKNFEKEVEKSEIPVILKFGATWCGPCNQMHPELEKLAKEYKGKVKVAEVDIDEEPDLAEKYEVNSVPDTHLFKKKTEKAEKNETVDNKIGYQNKDQLKAWLKSHGIEDPAKK